MIYYFVHPLDFLLTPFCAPCSDFPSWPHRRLPRPLPARRTGSRYLPVHYIYHPIHKRTDAVFSSSRREASLLGVTNPEKDALSSLSTLMILSPLLRTSAAINSVVFEPSFDAVAAFLAMLLIVLAHFLRNGQKHLCLRRLSLCFFSPQIFLRRRLF